jgi:hypothetical protein
VLEMSEKILGIICHAEGRRNGRIMRKYALVFFLESIFATKTGRFLGNEFRYYFDHIGFSCTIVDSKRIDKLKDETFIV